MDWVMTCALVPTRVVPKGLWVVWWRGATLGMGKDIVWENKMEEVVMVMMVVEMG